MDKIKNLLSQVGIQLNENQEKQFQKYIELILNWNKRINLISRKDEAKIVENHFLESLAFLLSFDLSPGTKIIDIGSGAGFPALPISLLRSEINFLLVESKRMKALFLKEVVSKLILKNAAVVCERVENFAQDPRFSNRFDFAFSRAVSRLDVVFGWIEKILKPGGFYIAWKGGKIEEEVIDLQKKNRKINVDVIQMDQRLVSQDKERVFVKVQRI